jgi:hypothetical protein
MNIVRERWQDLCEQASSEPDSGKLMLLVTEINFILAAKEESARKALAGSRRQAAA